MDAYVVAGYRTAVTKSGRGGFKSTRPDNLGACVIKHLLANVPAIDPSQIEDLIVGNAVPEAEQGMQMGRMLSLMALPISVPGLVINRYCGSGLEAIAIAAARIHSGMNDIIIAGGAESMSLVPTMGYKTALDYGFSTEHPDYYTSMGLTAEAVSSTYGISRELQDQFSYNSHLKALSAQKEGKFKSQIVPVSVTNTFVNEAGKQVTTTTIIDTDEGPRADTNLEALGKLKPVFAKNGSVTAGNSSQTSDGASFVMVVSEKVLKQYNLTPIARFCSYAVTGVAPRLMGIGPVEAIPMACKKVGIQIQDLDLIELNEAFAAQSLAVINTLGLNTEIVNVNGGAIALGHPLGCSGAKLSVQLLNELSLRNARYGMVTACVGGGQGIAGIFEYLH